MKVVLAEKPSVARDIAAFVGARARKDGYFEGQGYQITWAFGHLVTLKEPDEYDPVMKRWTLETLPFIPDDFLLKLTGDSGARKQFDIVAKLFCEAEELICATDAGREGELIFRYIQKMSDCEDKPLKRLWLSSLTEQAIRRAFDDLRPGAEYDSLYAAARCRSESDWIVGLNATRNYTVRYGQGGVLWSVGRVQTPVLALIARRDDEIRNFIPEPFWELATRYREVTFKHRGDRFNKQEEAEALLTKIQSEAFQIDKVTSKREKSQPPLLYDLTTLQRDMNTRFGLSAADTLKVAQNLYESKALTYPRTDSRYLSKDMQATMPGVLKALSRQKPNEIAQLDMSKLSTSKRIYDDKMVNDHHAIIPTESTPSALTGHAAAVYEMVVIRTISAFYPVCQKEVTIVDGSTAEVPFRAKGIRIVDPGWTAIQPKRSKKDKNEEEQDLPAFTQGETGPHTAKISEGVTKPPRHFSEASLLGAMETAGKLIEDEQRKEALKSKGIGTPATRAAIIETLLKRHYIVRDKKNLAATDLGRYLIALIQDPILKSPELTGDWEAKLKEIEMGKLDPQSFMAEISAFTHDLIRNSEMRMDPNGLGPCPRCGHRVIEGQRGYGCSDWNQGCSFVMWKDYKGHAIGAYQASELLQRNISLRPLVLDEQRVILCLSDRGFVMDILMPTRDMQRRGQGAKPAGGTRTKGSRSTGTGTSSKSAAGAPRKTGTGSPAKKKRSPKTQAPVVCPLCQKPMMEVDTAFICSAARTGCRFQIHKTIAGKKVSKAMAKKLLTSGKTQVLKGFQSKAGKAFDARLKLEDGKVAFEFEG